jgi:tartrate-resistant acid phosphatase type 5
LAYFGIHHFDHQYNFEMKKILFSFVVFILFVPVFGQKPFDGGYRGGTIDGLKKIPGALEFIVVGDWGRSGEYFQKDVATQMGKASYQLGADFIVSTGDNIYPKGVASVHDPLWKTNFEDIYTAFSLQKDWFPVLGNHDYAGNPQAELDYGKISRRWIMPARYHSMEKRAGDGTKVLLVFMDTSPFEKGYHASTEEPFRSNIRSQDTTTQKEWLINTLKNSDADWKIVFGHHPLYTSGPRKGRINTVAASLQPVLESHGADLFIAGHEHVLEHDQLSPKLTHIISGAGSEVTPSTGNPLTRFVASEHGFITCSVNKQGVFVQFINHEAKIIYTTQVKK